MIFEGFMFVVLLGTMDEGCRSGTRAPLVVIFEQIPTLEARPRQPAEHDEIPGCAVNSH